MGIELEITTTNIFEIWSDEKEIKLEITGDIRESQIEILEIFKDILDHAYCNETAAELIFKKIWDIIGHKLIKIRLWVGGNDQYIDVSCKRWESEKKEVSEK
jgi:hypothetical protein